jgi:hypothetical protein
MPRLYPISFARKPPSTWVDIFNWRLFAEKTEDRERKFTDNLFCVLVSEIDVRFTFIIAVAQLKSEGFIFLRSV